MRAYSNIRAVLRECEKALLDHRRDPLLAVLGITGRVTLRDGIAKYVAYLDANASHAHAKVRKSILRRWADSVDVGHVDVVATPHVQQYIDKLVKERNGKANWTVRNALAAIRAFLAWACDAGYVGVNVAMKARRPKMRFQNPKSIAVEKMPEVLDAASKAGGNVQLAIALAYYAGLRRSEITRLEWDHVDLEADLLTLPEEVTKTWRARTIPIHPRLKAILQAVHGNRGTVRKVMRGFRADGSCDPDKLGKAVDREMQARIGWRVGLQRLRRSFATHLLDRGVLAWIVAVLCGHDVSVQQHHYASRDGGKYADAIKTGLVA